LKKQVDDAVQKGRGLMGGKLFKEKDFILSRPVLVDVITP